MIPTPDYLGNEHGRKVLKKTDFATDHGRGGLVNRLPVRVESRRRVANLGNGREGTQRGLVRASIGKRWLIRRFQWRAVPSCCDIA